MKDELVDSLSGNSSKNFCLKALSRFDASELLDVIDGLSTACIARDFISSSVIFEAVNEFWNSPGLQTREDADASFVGAYHFGKSLQEYLKQTEAQKIFVENLSRAAADPIKTVINALRQQLERRGESLRPAAHFGIESNSFVMRSWQYEGEYALDPHEDAAQLSSPDQKGFEVQSVEGPLISVNLCFENGVGGDLRIWNVQPNESDRVTFGTTVRGYPYAERLLASVPSMNVVVRPGDLYCFDARNVHAVLSPIKRGERRTTMAFLIARLNKSNFIYWT
jgi:hypothetical protein